MSSEHEELSGYQYLVKYVEKGVVVMDKIRNGTDLLEEEELYLKSIHKIFFSGDYPIYRTKAVLSDEKPIQGGLFDASVSKSTIEKYIASVNDDMAQ